MPLRDNSGMNTSNTHYKRHRFPAEIIQHSVWLYYRVNLNHRDIEDLWAERGITVSYGAIRLWCNKFGPQYAGRLKRRQQGFGDTSRYANNRAELSHQLTRVRERRMRRFKSTQQAQRFLSVPAAVYNLFNLGRNLISAEHYRLIRQRAFASWEYATTL